MGLLVGNKIILFLSFCLLLFLVSCFFLGFGFLATSRSSLLYPLSP
jgi:hypothetical protein